MIINIKGHFFLSIKLFIGIILIGFQQHQIFAQINLNQPDSIIKAWAAPDDFPDHIILSATKDLPPQLNKLRTQPLNKTGYVEIAIAGDGPKFTRKFDNMPKEHY